jgi:hypothetical protein
MSDEHSATHSLQDLIAEVEGLCALVAEQTALIERQRARIAQAVRRSLPILGPDLPGQPADASAGT